MKLTHDPAHNVAYLRFKDVGEQVETIHVSDELNVDVAPDGSIYGIELLNASEQLGHADVEQALAATMPPRYKIEIYEGREGGYFVRLQASNGEVKWAAGPFANVDAARATADTMHDVVPASRVVDLSAA